MTNNRYTAKEKRTCWKCNGAIQIGQHQTWDRSGAMKGVWYHVDCTEDVEVTASMAKAAQRQQETGEPYTCPESAKDPEWKTSAKPQTVPLSKSRINPYPTQEAANDTQPVPLPSSPAEPSTDSGDDPIPQDKPDRPADVFPENETERKLLEVMETHQQIIEKLGAKNKAQDAKINKQTEKLDKLESVIEKLEGATQAVSSNSLEHKDYRRLLAYVKAESKVFLWGSLPGTGKSHATSDIAKELEIDYGSISLTKQTPDHRLMGFVDAQGRFQETPFYRWANSSKHTSEKGSLFTIEEICNGSPAVLTSLNSMLEHGYIAFPNNEIINVDFKKSRLVVLDNTDGKGGSPKFPDREALDGAFITRFDFMEWRLDEKLEQALCDEKDNSPLAKAWLKWVRTVRSYCEVAYDELIVSPRTSFSGIRLLRIEGNLDLLAESTLWKGLDKNTVSSIMSACPYPKKLSDSFEVQK